jgi:hypothetical protein
MKNLFLLLLIVVLGAECKANTDSLFEYTPDVVDELLFQGFVETHPELAYQTTTNAQKAGFLKDVWRFITSPFRPVWGKFEEPGHRGSGPYTVFQHHKATSLPRWPPYAKNNMHIFVKVKKSQHLYKNITDQ